MYSLGAIILAAGLSRRMGARNKLLLPINGKPMVRYVVETYLAVADAQICVVTGFEADKIEAALAGLPVQFAHNSDYKAGQPFSVIGPRVSSKTKPRPSTSCGRQTSPI
jgi:molybdenum cofactor cytidylyltransferase